MMSFCKKSVHSLFGLTTITTSMDTVTDTTTPFDKSPCKHSANPGIGLITATGETLRPPHVIESSFLKHSPSQPPPPPPPTPILSLPGMFAKKDPGGIGFLDGVNGLMSCTESLGFESSDERTADNHHRHHQIEMDTRVESPTRTKGRKDVSDRREMKKFPPPLSSFNRNGQPTFFLRSVRTGGRLELTEIRVDRPEILRASREDGRLRLHLIRNDEDLEINNKIEEEEEEEEEGEEEPQQETIIQEEEEEENEEEEEEERVGEWQLPESEVLRRCNELGLSKHHHHHQNISHHHNLLVWRQHCVPTR